MRLNARFGSSLSKFLASLPQNDVNFFLIGLAKSYPVSKREGLVVIVKPAGIAFT